MKQPDSFGGSAFKELSKQTREALLKQALERAESRAEIRRPVFLNATIYLPHGVRMNCVALDISPLGARVRVIRTEPLAPVIEVSIHREVVRQRARIAWRDKGDIGLEYLNPNLSKDALVDLLLQMEGLDERPPLSDSRQDLGPAFRRFRAFLHGSALR